MNNAIKAFRFILVTFIILNTNCVNDSATNLSKIEVSGKTGLKTGDTAPSFALPDAVGDTLRLDDFKNDIVLIYFWASWCPNCREKNPGLVNLFNQYSDKTIHSGGKFTILSISLDEKKDAWLNAIKQDGLSWNTHVSDLKGANSITAAMYQVRSIPHNLLLDTGNIIIGKNLGISELEIFMKNRF